MLRVWNLQKNSRQEGKVQVCKRLKPHTQTHTHARAHMVRKETSSKYRNCGTLLIKAWHSEKTDISEIPYEVHFR